MFKSRQFSAILQLGRCRHDHIVSDTAPILLYQRRLYKQCATMVTHSCRRDNILCRQNHTDIFHHNCGRQRTFQQCRFAQIESSVSNEGQEKITSDQNLQELAGDLIQNASNQDKMVLSVPKKQVTRGLQDLMEFGFKIKAIRTLFMHPDLLINISDLIQIVKLFSKLGFTAGATAHILRKVPDLPRMECDEVLKQFNALRSVGFGTKGLINIVRQEPIVLKININKQVIPRMEALKLLLKTKDAFNSVEKVPRLLTCDFSEIEDKFHYVFTEMGITQRQMMNADLFSCSMDHIVTRHMFLVRAGLFKKIVRRDRELNKNPLLQNILGFSDAKFAMKFGDMTPQHYQTFKKLLQKEKQYITSLDEEGSYKT